MRGETLFDWFSTTTLLGLSLSNWLLVIAASVGSYLVMTLGLRFALSRARRIAERRRGQGLDDAVVELLEGTNRWLILLAAVLIGVSLLDLPERWAARVGQLWFIAVALQFALWGSRAIGVLLRRYEARHSSSAMTQVSASATLMSWGLRTVLWAVVLLAMLSNLGVNITAFVASLGVGGIAVALAVQNILGDLFASLSIAVDKPFEVGDFVVVNGSSGTVEHVGLKSTRIRSLSGEQIIMSNTDLLKQTISNYKRLSERRIVFKFGVTYDTAPEQAEQIPQIVQRIVASSDKLRFDRAHLQSFGESSLDYEVVYIVLDPSYNLYMDLQQMINLELMRELKKIGVDFAFPTRTVIVSNAVQNAASGVPAAAPAPASALTRQGAARVV
ncbi:mechanosensitive ion channel family protein [Caldimonas brevitalea]|uniref:Mechanosensitive ion channel protein MscS n=1 Tax=Caldimonas brevitalea TaxID=413882 RepID=A0A0G3BFJ1_9BURK|nr:mechanosensitive ion channel family protein [Caldimonas brevitalea]AKJ28087.1 mechanosensitive ion channel protein MscS [Caldimonas brevitalea]